jgi:cytidyltransferase-like protein
LNDSVYSLRQTAKNLRAARAGKKVVLAGGTFDIIHPGHLKYLARCRSKGDLLVVYVAGDARTRRRKGPSRPLLPAIQRAKLVSNLKMVDFAFISNSSPFNETILRKIHPDVIVTSSNEPSRIIKRNFQRYMQQKHPDIKVVLVRRPSSSWSSSALIKSITGGRLN